MDVKSDDRPEALGPCPLCGRLMRKGNSVDRHHWRPKSRRGTEATYLHRTCHRKLHSLFSDKELVADLASLDQVRQHPEIQKFIRWVRRQPPERVMRHRKPRTQP